jgi:hypothetical protein
MFNLSVPTPLGILKLHTHMYTYTAQQLNLAKTGYRVGSMGACVKLWNRKQQCSRPDTTVGPGPGLVN